MTALLIEPARDWMARQTEELKRRKGEKLRRRILRDLVWSEEVLAGIALSIWKWVREKLEEEGFEGRELTRYCQLVLDGIDGRLSGYEQLLASAEEAGLAPETVGLLDLQAKLPALREARPKVAEILELANRPPRSVDEAKLNASKGTIDLQARGLNEAEAAELRSRWGAAAEDWDRPEMDVYNDL